MPANTPKRIKNWTSTTEAPESMAIIREALRQHKARQIRFETDSLGRSAFVSFTLLVDSQFLSFRIAAELDNVQELILEAYPDRRQLTETLREQAYRTAWANIRDWVLAQLAMVDSRSKKMEQVFFADLLDDDGLTYFEAYAQQALPAPRGSVRISEER